MRSHFSLASLLYCLCWIYALTVVRTSLTDKRDILSSLEKSRWKSTTCFCPSLKYLLERDEHSTCCKMRLSARRRTLPVTSHCSQTTVIKIVRVGILKMKQVSGSIGLAWFVKLRGGRTFWSTFIGEWRQWRMKVFRTVADGRCTSYSNWGFAGLKKWLSF